MIKHSVTTEFGFPKLHETLLLSVVPFHTDLLKWASFSHEQIIIEKQQDG